MLKTNSGKKPSNLLHSSESQCNAPCCFFLLLSFELIIVNESSCRKDINKPTEKNYWLTQSTSIAKRLTTYWVLRLPGMKKLLPISKWISKSKRVWIKRGRLLDEYPNLCLCQWPCLSLPAINLLINTCEFVSCFQKVYAF